MRDYMLFVPEYLAAGLAVVIIAIELFWPGVRKETLAYLTALAAAGWGAVSLGYLGREPESFQGLIQIDNFTTFFRLMGAGIVIVVSLLSAQYLRERTKTAAEYYGLLLIAGCAMVFMAAARELITAYIALELLSFCLYVLVGYLKRDNLSSEASLKYILLGAFSSAIFLYGMSLIYGVTHSTYYDEIATALSSRAAGTDQAAVVGFMLILAGVGFKVSAAPFQWWAPDAYEGAPLPVTAFLSTASKAAGFALIIRLFTSALTPDVVEWRWAVAIVAGVTMTMGNLVAIQQTSMKRLIAYSSIGQVGYMLVVLAAIGWGDQEVGRNASTALLLHLTGYVISTLALFAALTAYYNRTGKDTITGLRGMAETQPFLAMVITVSLFSFAGLPFFAGFATKLFMFQASITGDLLWLVGLAVLNSFISLYYYLMVIRQMYLFNPEEGLARFKISPVLWATGAVLMLGVVFIGTYPAPAFEAAERATETLFEQGPPLEARVP
ncbi:NADH-quinone oxidoreductase subunit N [bacterium]|nr:MAG: NADH-quinone oxidoreductase subunit N [bacterium]MCL4232615.1 NADH-quinone oxidoreductase subunit N [Dehalococcoidia bacterium]